MRQRHQDNPIGWMLTEVDDQGNPVTENSGEPNAMESLSKSRAGRMLFEYKGVIIKTGREWISAGSTKILGFLGLVLGMIMVPVYLFFFLKDSSSIREHWHDYVPLKNSQFKTELVETLQEINGYLVSFFRGQVLVAAIDGFLVGTALTLFGLPYGFIIGIFMAILGVVPYIGSILCLIPACIIGYLHAQGSSPFGMSSAAYVGCVVAIFVVVQQINSLVTAPKIVGDSVGLHPLTVIFSMLFWSLLLGGFVGALLAVPLTAAVKVLFRRYIWVRGRLV
jgi:predicted PurR-regulated permease PerM